MTTPAPQPGQQPPPPPSGLDDPDLAVAVAAVLAGGVVTLSPVIAGLAAKHALTRAELAALSGILADVTAHPPPLTGVIGPASQQVASMNAARRAAYVVAASKRVKAAGQAASAAGKPVRAAMAAQRDTEKRYYAAHQAAMWQRAAAAGRVDMEAAVHGRLLGWYAVKGDKKTTPECLAADGCNFYVDNPPEIGLPGIVHVNCRCFPGPAHPGGQLLPGSGPGYARAA